MDSDVYAEQPQLRGLNLTNEVRMTESTISPSQDLLLTKVVFAELIDLLLSWKRSPSDRSYRP